MATQPNLQHAPVLNMRTPKLSGLITHLPTVRVRVMKAEPECMHPFAFQSVPRLACILGPGEVLDAQ